MAAKRSRRATCPRTDASTDSEEPAPRRAASDPGLKGRFSGRLRSKADEAALAAECRLIGPLLGGTPDGSGGDSALATLSAIVRAIASGDVRRYLQRLHAAAGEVGRQGLQAQPGAGPATDAGPFATGAAAAAAERPAPQLAAPLGGMPAHLGGRDSHVAATAAASASASAQLLAEAFPPMQRGPTIASAQALPTRLPPHHQQQPQGTTSTAQPFQEPFQQPRMSQPQQLHVAQAPLSQPQPQASQWATAQPVMPHLLRPPAPPQPQLRSLPSSDSLPLGALPPAEALQSPVDFVSVPPETASVYQGTQQHPASQAEQQPPRQQYGYTHPQRQSFLNPTHLLPVTTPPQPGDQQLSLPPPSLPPAQQQEHHHLHQQQSQLGPRSFHIVVRQPTPQQQQQHQQQPTLQQQQHQQPTLQQQQQHQQPTLQEQQLQPQPQAAPAHTFQTAPHTQQEFQSFRVMQPPPSAQQASPAMQQAPPSCRVKANSPAAHHFYEGSELQPALSGSLDSELFLLPAGRQLHAAGG